MELTFFDFLRQLPLGLVACTCLSGLGVLGIWGYIIYARIRRSRAQNAPASGDTQGAYASMGDGDLPELDVLLDIAPAPATASAPAPQRAAKPGAYAVKLADTGENVQAVEVMVILRDVDEGRLIVQLGEQAYSNLSAQPDSKARFMKIMKELANVVVAKAGAPAPADPPAAPEPSAPAAERAAEIPSVASLINTPPEARPATPPPPLPDGSMPGDLPKFKLAEQPLAPRRGIGLMRRSKDEQREISKPVPEINIAQAIQEYLQYKLRHTPQYAGRSINVTPSPSGGVTIEVDGKFYDAVSDIEDMGVRTFMQETIAEWQSRQ
ncbi:MAG: hypothetical protein HXY40_02935 [Chloroflexi bacterium]|nr:hypothetical protein [Chloroflexota bacterium]